MGVVTVAWLCDIDVTVMYVNVIDLAVRQGKHDSHTLKTYINNFSSKNMGPKGVDFSRDISTSFLNSLLAEADGISEKVKNFLSKEKDGNSSSGGSSSS